MQQEQPVEPKSSIKDYFYQASSLKIPSKHINCDRDHFVLANLISSIT